MMVFHRLGENSLPLKITETRFPVQRAASPMLVNVFDNIVVVVRNPNPTKLNPDT